MQIVRTRAELRAVLAAAPRPIGLVPTMGWLHAGHVSLVDRARAESATVVVSIFVNPRQFGQSADFARYPRNEARDLAMCEAAGVDVVFAPSVDEVYPPGFDTRVVRRRDRGAARGRGTAGALRRRGHRGRDPVRARRRGAGVLRPQGLPAGPGDPAHGDRPGTADRGRALRDRPRARRPGAVVAQRTAHARGPRRGARAPARAARGRGTRCGPASGPARPCATRCWRCSPRSRRRHRTTCPSPTRTRSRSWTWSPAGRCCRSRSLIDDVRLIDNERVL